MASLLRTLAPLAAFPWAVSASTLSSLRGHATMDSKMDGRLSGVSFCAPVIDAGPMGLIDIQVGSNNTTVSLVVDTGSNVLIVESCECQAAEVCPDTEACINMSTSSSFKQLTLPSGEDREMTLRFGSGSIKGRIGLDDVSIGGSKIPMKDGMLFMTDRALDFSGDFEGILGLGPSSVIVEHAQAEARAQIEKQLKEMGEMANSTNATEYDKQAYAEAVEQFKQEFNADNPEPLGFLEQANQRRFSLCFGKGDDTNGTLVVGGEPAEHALTSIGMLHWGLALEGVYVGNSAVMFQPQSDYDMIAEAIAQAIASGALDANAVKDAQAAVIQAGDKEAQAVVIQAGGGRSKGYANVSTVSKSDGKNKKDASLMAKLLRQQAKLEKKREASRVPLCSRQANMTEGQETPCGGIPDSGTTALAMPQVHLDAVAEAICDNWDRCLNNFTALGRAKEAAEKAAIKEYGVNPFDIPEFSKAEVLNFVLSDCANYNKSLEDVMAEMPDIQVTLGDGTTSHLLNVTIPGPSYVFQIDLNAMYEAYGEAMDPNMSILNKTAEPQMACTLGLQASEYNTEKNGDIWILGKPLFHEYLVHYDIGDNSIGFTSTEEQPCGTCHASTQGLGLLSSDVTTKQSAKYRHRAPLKVRGGFRPPRVDTTLPL